MLTDKYNTEKYAPAPEAWHDTLLICYFGQTVLFPWIAGRRGKQGFHRITAFHAKTFPCISTRVAFHSYRQRTK